MRKTNSPRFTWNVTWLNATLWRVYSFATSSSVIMLRLLQRLLDVGDDIVGVFDADAQAKEAIRNSDCRARFTRHVRVRAVPRLDYEGIHSTKTRCVSDELELSNKTVGRRGASRELDRHESAKSIQHFLRDQVVDMARQSSVMDL